MAYITKGQWDEMMASPRTALSAMLELAATAGGLAALLAAHMDDNGGLAMDERIKALSESIGIRDTRALLKALHARTFEKFLETSVTVIGAADARDEVQPGPEAMEAIRRAMGGGEASA